MNKEVSKQFKDFEEKMLSNPKTAFGMMEVGRKERTNIIWQEFREWQRNSGKVRELEFKEIEREFITDLVWKIGNEWIAQGVDFLNAPFTKEQYKRALSAVYSFMEDRPQYYKFRNMKGMYNPLQLLLYKLL